MSNELNKVIKWAKDHVKILVMGFLGLGGTGTGIGYSDTIYNAFIDGIAGELGVHKSDSMIDVLDNKMNYQLGFNKLAMGNYVDTIMDGIPMKYDLNEELFWVEWNNYWYHAIREGHGMWVIFLFQWQVPPKADNRYVLDPRYFELQ